MTNELEDRVMTALRHRAEGPVDLDALLSGAVAAGKVRQRRRQTGMALTAAGVAGVTAATLAAGPFGGSGGGGSPIGGGVTGAEEPYRPVTSPDFPALPVAEGIPGLAQSPELVGTDPTALHFGTPKSPLPLESVDWGIGDMGAGVESMEWTMHPPGYIDDPASYFQRRIEVEVAAARGSLPPHPLEPPGPSTSEAATTVDGEPGTLTTWATQDQIRKRLTWRVGGVSMRVWMFGEGGHGGVTVGEPPCREVAGPRGESLPPCEFTPPPAITDEMMVSVAETLQLDTSIRCTAPFHLQTVPDGADLRGCANGRAVNGNVNELNPRGLLFVGESAQRQVKLYWSAKADRHEQSANATQPAGESSPGGPDTEFTFRRGIFDGTIQSHGYSAAEGQALVNGIEGTGDPADMSTWPRDPLP